MGLIPFLSPISIVYQNSDLNTRHGSHARARKGYFLLRPPVPTIGALVAKIDGRRDQGRHLRDTHGVGKSHYLTGSKILRVLKSLGAAPELPEDLYFMIKKAVGMRKHLERNRKDRDGKFRLILIESRIHRLSRYYRKKGVLPPNWKYESATASALVA